MLQASETGPINSKDFRGNVLCLNSINILLPTFCYQRGLLILHADHMVASAEHACLYMCKQLITIVTREIVHMLKAVFCCVPN